MALATAPDTFSDSLAPVFGDSLPPVDRSGGPGLEARMASLADALGVVVSELDPARLLGSDATVLYATFCRLERLVVAGKTLLAPRIAESGHWEAEGHRSPTSLLAEIEGGTPGQAKRTLETGQLLNQLPSTEEALRSGTLSGAKVTEIASAATVDPLLEQSLLAGAESEPLRSVKERCQRARVTAAGRDPMATERRIHAERYFRSWNDADGAFCFQGRDTAERGARLLASLGPVVTRLRNDRRAAAREEGGRSPGTGDAPPHEPEAALRADALFLLVGRRRVATPMPPAPVTGKGGDLPTAVPMPDTTADRDPVRDPEEPDDLVSPDPPATVMVRVDLEALRRRRAEQGDLCEIDGQGAVPVPVVANLLDDAFISLVFTESGDIRAISHLGRTINSHLRTALTFRDRNCVVPGCGATYGLEIDHVVPMERGGPTELGNLALLCHHHHHLKTYDGWTLERSGASDADPQWSFIPLPPFGQEPDLGLDRPDADRPTDNPSTERSTPVGRSQRLPLRE